MIKNIKKILLVEDNLMDRKLFESFLEDIDDVVFDLDHARSLGSAFEKIEEAGESKYDVVVLDLGLVDSQGLNTFLRFHSKFPKLPCIVLTGFDDDESAKQALNKGAHDYLVKGDFQVKELHRSIRFAINRQRIREKIKVTETDSKS